MSLSWCKPSSNPSIPSILGKAIQGFGGRDYVKSFNANNVRDTFWFYSVFFFFFLENFWNCGLEKGFSLITFLQIMILKFQTRLHMGFLMLGRQMRVIKLVRRAYWILRVWAFVFLVCFCFLSLEETGIICHIYWFNWEGAEKF